MIGASLHRRFLDSRLPYVGAAVLVAFAFSLIAGCAVKPIEPWVKPYEREHLADPIMSFSRDGLASKHLEHVRDVREGARGATGVQGGGCGCN
jgi:hypothetical protein